MWSDNSSSGWNTTPVVSREDGRAWSVVIAERLPLLREGLAAICEHRMGLRVAATCADGEDALRRVRAEEPDAALLDLDLPKLSSHEVIRRVRAEGLATKLLAFSDRADRKTVLETLRGGAHAFVLKTDSARFLAEAFRHVRRGSICVSPSVQPELLFASSREPSGEDPVDALSSREYQVFTLLVEGLRAKEIAARLDLSAKTVDTYRASLMRKLDIHDVAGLVKFAIRRNLTTVR